MASSLRGSTQEGATATSRRAWSARRFLDSARFAPSVFRFALDNFNNLEGVRERKFVNQLMQTRLEELANKLDPNVSGSLSNRIRLRQASSTSMTKSEVKEFYDDFYELWEPFLDDREWFAPDELSSYYRLAKPRLTMMDRSTSANE